MKTTLRVILVIMSLWGPWSFAKAQILYNSGGPINTGGSDQADAGDPSYTAMANSFVLSSSSEIASIQFDGIYNNGAVPSDSFSITFYDSSSGNIVTPALDTLTFSNLTRTNTGSFVEGQTLFQYQGTLSSPLTLSAGSYYLGLSDSTTPYEDFSFAVNTTSNLGTSYLYQVSSSSWSNHTTTTAIFQLDGPEPVPEPSTWATLLGGLGLLAFWRHRTRQLLV
jgi:hypothetical protein